MSSRLDQILRRHGVWTMQEFEAAQDDQDLYEALYTHFSTDGSMPYGTMKARSGDPGEWIFYTVEVHLSQN